MLKIADQAVPPFTNPDHPNLTSLISGQDHDQKHVDIKIVTERPVTLYLNKQEIVTMMTIGDFVEYLAIGYLFNQGIVSDIAQICDVAFEADLGVVVVRTLEETGFEAAQTKRIKTSGCAQGTIFGSVIDDFERVRLNADAKILASDMIKLQKHMNTRPSLYLAAGAIHGAALCQGARVLAFMEDVGRHNAVDKVAGYMAVNSITPSDKIFYTTGRLTSEMIIKTAMMQVPVLISRSGFTAYGVELARQAKMTLIGRARGKRFTILSGPDRVMFDADEV